MPVSGVSVGGEVRAAVLSFWPWFLLFGAALIALVKVGLNAGVAAAAERAVEKKFREWEVRFTVLHERRVAVIEALVVRFADLKAHLDQSISIKPTGGDGFGLEHLSAAATAGNEINRFLAARRYYFPKSTLTKIAAALDTLKSAHIELSIGAEGQVHGRGTDTHVAMYSEGFKKLRKTVPPLVEAVEDEFRRLLGVELDS